MPKAVQTSDFRAKLRRLLIVPVIALLFLGGLLSPGVVELVLSARWVDQTDQLIAIANELQGKHALDELSGEVHQFLQTEVGVRLSRSFMNPEAETATGWKRA